jgi:hypothetical protein
MPSWLPTNDQRLVAASLLLSSIISCARDRSDDVSGVEAAELEARSAVRILTLTTLASS